jgi:hypothetical protein
MGSGGKETTPLVDIDVVRRGSSRYGERRVLLTLAVLMALVNVVLRVCALRRHFSSQRVAHLCR